MTAAHGTESHQTLRAVVKLLTLSDAPDHEQPWQTQGTVSSSGSGAIVETSRGPRILTNAHVVENQMFVEAQRYGRSRKFEVTVEGVGHVCDLALLTVDDPAFFEGATPIDVGGLPDLGDHVSVLGYPIGGDGLSITEGIVSRIEMSQYAQSQRRLLAVQIDAAINAGNSGGPVMANGELVGIAFQGHDEGQNIGYMIGSPVVKHFLRDMEDGTFDGFPDLGVSIQPLESTSHRRSLGLPNNRLGGVLVKGVNYEGSSWGELKAGDVLVEVDGVRVAGDGSVRFRKGSRLDYSYVVSQRHVGEQMAVRIWRRDKDLVLTVRLVPPRPLVAENAFDVKPTYYVHAGLLFVPLSGDYLATWGPEWWSDAPGSLVALYESGIRAPQRQQIVVLQKVLADRVNRGYHDFSSLVVATVEDKPVRDIRDLVHRVEQASGEFLRFSTTDGSSIVLDRAQAIARSPAILHQYGVPADRSTDLQ